MRLPGFSAHEAASLLVLLATPTAAMLRCSELVVDGHKFDFGPLGGPHSVVTSEFHPPTFTNTTYTLDICAFLKRSGDVPKDQQCANGARGTLRSERWDVGRLFLFLLPSPVCPYLLKREREKNTLDQETMIDDCDSI